MKIQSLISKQTTLLLIALVSLSMLLLPLTTLQAATLTNGMDASWVLGTSALDAAVTSGAPTQSETGGSEGVAYDSVRKRLFVIDRSNKRVLVFDVSGGITNGMNASYVIGQDDFISNVNTTTQSGFQAPSGIAYSLDHLYVSDANSHRVLVFDVSGGITNGMNASYVLGQNDFTSLTANRGISAAQGNMSVPGALAVSGNNLFVSDTGNKRVQVFDIESITNGESSTYVIGQEDFSATVVTTTQDGIYSPWGLAVNDQYLFLIDQDWSQVSTRILVFDVSGGITNGMDADYVLGQPDFTSTVSDNSRVTASSFNQAWSLYATNETLYVGDSYNNRALIFDISGGIENEMDASYVLGQEDFVSNTANVNGEAGGGGGKGGGLLPCASCFAISGGGIYYDDVNDYLYVGDVGNKRLMVWDLSPTVASSTGWSYITPPQCSATFSPNTITKGESTTLSWNTQWPTDRENSYYTKVPGEGLYSQNVQSLTLTPQHTTTYTLAIFNLWGANFCEAAITVLDENGEELTSNQNSYLTAGVSNAPFVKAISNFFKSLF